MCHPFDKHFSFWATIGERWLGPPFPFVFSSWTFVVKVFLIMVEILKEVINGVVLFVLHPLTQLIKMIWSSQPQDCLEVS